MAGTRSNIRMSPTQLKVNFGMGQEWLHDSYAGQAGHCLLLLMFIGLFPSFLFSPANLRDCSVRSIVQKLATCSMVTQVCNIQSKIWRPFPQKIGAKTLKFRRFWRLDGEY